MTDKLISPAAKNSTYTESLARWESETGIDWYDSDITEGMRQGIVDTGEGIQLCVEVGGNPKNPPLIMVMGLGSQMIFWPDNLIKLLITSGFFVVRFDNRDSGLSTKIKSESFIDSKTRLKMMIRLQLGMRNHHIDVPYSLEDMADDVARLIQVLHLSKANLLGASMGGIISQILAAKHPDLVDNLVVMISTTNRAMQSPTRPKQLQGLFRKPYGKTMEDSLNHSVWFMNTVGTPGHVDANKVRKVSTIRYKRCFRPIGTVQQLNAILSTGSVTHFTRQITAPTLVMSGSKDGLMPASHGRNIAKTVKNGHFHLIEGMGHDLPNYYLPHIANMISKHCLTT